MIEIEKLIGADCQIWIATHSIGFLRALQEDFNDVCDIIHFKDNVNWGNSPQILKPMIKSRKNWLDIFFTALDDLTELVAPKRMVYCEGEAKPKNSINEQGLDAIVLNNIFSEGYPDTLFISSGGNTEPSQRRDIAISILRKPFPTMDLWVLNDRDLASGKITTEADRQTYLSNNHQHCRMLNRFEIENYLFDKESLKAFCLAEGHNFNELLYDALGLDINNDDLKSKTSIMKNICGIKMPINPEKFKENISKIITKEMNVFKELESCIFERK